jgi:hypothetical protein
MRIPLSELDLTSLAGTCAGVTWTFVNETSRHDPEKRAYVSAMVSGDDDVASLSSRAR